MNKNAIQKYAVWARNELIEQIKQRAYQYGISGKGYGEENATVISGRALSPEEKRQRHEFVSKIKKHSYQQAVEEVAYTWFNRFIALRYMEVNDYLPTHVRVFSDTNGEFNPEILREVLHLDMTELDKMKASDLINANQTEELYRYLLLTQCNALNEVLPEMFEHMGSYTEMLLPNNILKPDSVLGRLVTDIPEEDFKDAVQIIGWMYQYYNTEPKQAVFDGLKKNVKITKEKIPAATQLFTPDWIVRYMVENSLGRLWIEHLQSTSGFTFPISFPISIKDNSTKIAELKANWKYYLDEAKQAPEVAEHLRILRSQSPVKSPEDISLIDPCMGSGHILVYAFDVLMQIYESEGYNPRDVAKLILEKNIYGLDIDQRAYQLAYFSLMMKARQYNRRIFTDDIMPQVYHPAGFLDGEEYGSLVKVEALSPIPIEKIGQLRLEDTNFNLQLNEWNFKRLLAQKYDVVITNPPYMSAAGMSSKMYDFTRKYYPDSKNDLFAVFIEKCREFLKPHGYQAMITMQSWMFLPSLKQLRNKMIVQGFVNLAHLGSKAFEEISGEVVQTVSFVMQSGLPNEYRATFVKLTEFSSQDEKDAAFVAGANRYNKANSVFLQLPESPIIYWISDRLQETFASLKIVDVYDPKTGVTTGDNTIFLRLWFEISFSKMSVKWYPMNKGGTYRKWYGNNEYVVDWENNGKRIKSFPGSTIRNEQYYFREGVTWSKISTSNFAGRFSPASNMFDAVGLTCFSSDDNDLFYLLAYMNSVVADNYVKMLNPTLSYTVGTISNLPLIVTSDTHTIKRLAAENVNYCRIDWDSFETSWDFKRHPLLCGELTVAAAFDKWKREAAERFEILKANEQELNRIFIDIYGLQEELTPEVEDKDVTVHRADLVREIRSLISYAVGCMFGRYSLDVEGLAYAGGDWDAGKYRSYIPDEDNILPICDDEYFDDDILGRFVDFIRVVYGAETLEENLKFIADALGGNGTPREVIRNYFLSDFYKDHCKIYQKTPDLLAV